jgi:hypothetical protein
MVFECCDCGRDILPDKAIQRPIGQITAVLLRSAYPLIYNFALVPTGKSPLEAARLAPTRGAYRDRHGRWTRDAMDGGCASRRARGSRTAKSCGPDASTLALTW